TRIAQKRTGGRSVLKELGPHPETGKDVQVLSGRYGPYVSDGETNATIPKTVDPMQVQMDDAVDLLKERAAKGGGRRPRGGAGGRGRGARKAGPAAKAPRRARKTKTEP